MEQPTKQMYDKLGETVVKALQKRGFEALYCTDAASALQAALAAVGTDEVVSWGGARSAEQIGLIDALKARNPVIDRKTGKDRAEELELMRRALLCDTFIMGANGISADGQLVNLDGNGNRVAALCYGPKKVVVIAGMNKVMPTLEDAIARVRGIAAPMNAQRFEGVSPCRKTGQCADCLSRDSICAQLVVTRLCKPLGRIHVILVGEPLGF